LKHRELKFFKTPIDENLSSGLPERTITVIAGLPGAGKSTLALQIANEILKREEIKILYISSEEPPELIKQRAQRVTPELIYNDDFKILCETLTEKIKDGITTFLETNPESLIILDSINALRSGSSLSPPGSPSNITKTLNMLHHLRLKNEFTITQIIIAHANKQRTVAGPLTLQHMVDIVLFFDIEKDGKRTITTLKNRFGPAGIKTIQKL
jgi:DNA repair protein RadA/Sms